MTIPEKIADAKTPEAMNKPYSPTQMGMMSKCGEQYRRRYIEGEILPPGISLLKGSGFHKAAEANMRQKMESYEDLPVQDIQDIAVASFDESTHGEFAMTSEEHSRGSSVVLGEAKDSLSAMSYLHAIEQAPDYQPIMVEQKVEIVIPNSPRNLLGVIDLGTDQNEVVDFKTSGRKKSQSDVDDSLQLTVYAAAFHAITGTPAENVKFDCVIQTKTKTYRQVLKSNRFEADFAALAERINMMDSAIQAGVFLPAPPDAWWCSDKWCGYYRTCPYTRQGQRELVEFQV